MFQVIAIGRDVLLGNSKNLRKPASDAAMSHAGASNQAESINPNGIVTAATTVAETTAARRVPQESISRPQVGLNAMAPSPPTRRMIPAVDDRTSRPSRR